MKDEDKLIWNFPTSPLISMLGEHLEHVVDRVWFEYIFDSNDPVLRQAVVAAIHKDLDDAVSKKLISGYKVICDEENNTLQVINNNQLKADIHLAIPDYDRLVYIPITIMTL